MSSKEGTAQGEQQTWLLTALPGGELRGGDVPGKPSAWKITTKAGQQHPKKVELLLVLVRSGSHQSSKTAPRLYTG